MSLITIILLIGIGLYITLSKVIPFFVYPNYFRASAIESYPELRAIAKSLVAGDKIETLQNIYRYFREHYTGKSEWFRPKNILHIFDVGDFPTNALLSRRSFLLCHTQNRLFRSILLNTGVFNESEIVIRTRYCTSLFVHQWIEVNLPDRKITIDPYYGIFEPS